MGIAKKTDGRYVVGLGVTDANDYKGSASYRDIYIQLTADGATEESVTYLTYLKDYAIYHSSLGEPIMPPSVNVWISNNGVTTAVEADDLSLDGDDFTICGIVYSDGTWDYSNAGSGHGGGGGVPTPTAEDVGKIPVVNADGEYELADAPSGLPSTTSADAGKVLAVNASGEWAAELPYDFIMTTTDDDGPYEPAAIIKGDYNLLVDAVTNMRAITGLMICDEQDQVSYWYLTHIIQPDEEFGIGLYFMSAKTSMRAFDCHILSDNTIVF